jgi:manganese/zinc/iron transport system permease protein
VNPTVVILIVGSCVAAACALVGTFLVLRKMALLGDAISHAILPGIVIAFLLTGERAPVPMVIGAGVFGVLTVFLVELFNRTRRLKEDASIGVVFPALFSLGVLLISRYAAQVDLDLDCVLYGEIAYTPWDSLLVGETGIGPKALWVNGFVLLLNLALVLLFYKELKLTTFDPQLAASLGFSPILIHYLLMSAVSVTAVGAFESVGAILVVAMLIVPPATAYLLTDRLSLMLIIGVAIGIASAIAGYWVAHVLDASIAGAMAMVSGAFFLLAFLVSPRYGLLARLLRERKLGAAMAEQLLLAHLRPGERSVPFAQLARRFSWSGTHLQRTVRRLQNRGWVDAGPSGLRLTLDGLEAIESTGQKPLLHQDPT